MAAPKRKPLPETPPLAKNRKVLNVWVSKEEHDYLRVLANTRGSTMALELRFLLRREMAKL